MSKSIINLNIATKKYDKQIEIETITASSKTSTWKYCIPETKAHQAYSFYTNSFGNSLILSDNYLQSLSPSLGMYSYSSRNKLEQKELTSKDKTTIDLANDGSKTISTLRKIVNVTNTVQHDGENMDYSSLQHHNGPDCITKSDTPRFSSNRKHSLSEGKLNSVNQPSNTYYPFHSPFHMLPSSSTNGILDQTIHSPIDNINLDLYLYLAND